MFRPGHHLLPLLAAKAELARLQVRDARCRISGSSTRWSDLPLTWNSSTSPPNGTTDMPGWQQQLDAFLHLAAEHRHLQAVRCRPRRAPRTLPRVTTMPTTWPATSRRASIMTLPYQMHFPWFGCSIRGRSLADQAADKARECVYASVSRRGLLWPSLRIIAGCCPGCVA
jgi:hypothetical protein